MADTTTSTDHIRVFGHTIESKRPPMRGNYPGVTTERYHIQGTDVTVTNCRHAVYTAPNTDTLACSLADLAEAEEPWQGFVEVRMAEVGSHHRIAGGPITVLDAHVADRDLGTAILDKHGPMCEGARADVGITLRTKRWHHRIECDGQTWDGGPHYYAPVVIRLRLLADITPAEWADMAAHIDGYAHPREAAWNDLRPYAAKRCRLTGTYHEVTFAWAAYRNEPLRAAAEVQAKAILHTASPRAIATIWCSQSTRPLRDLRQALLQRAINTQDDALAKLAHGLTAHEVAA